MELTVPSRTEPHSVVKPNLEAGLKGAAARPSTGMAHTKLSIVVLPVITILETFSRTPRPAFNVALAITCV